MNKRVLYLSLLVLLAASAPVLAATNYVILGGDFQAAINASSNNDIIVVYPAVYTTNLIFDRPLTVVRSTVNTNALQLQGNIQITGSGASSFSQCEFSAPVQVQFTGTVSFAQCKFFNTVTSQWANVLLSQVNSSTAFGVNLSSVTGTNLQAYDSSFSALTVSGGRVLLKRSALTGLTLSGSAALEALRMTNFGLTTATATLGSNTPFVVVQSQFSSPVSLSGYKVWLGYNFNGSALQLTNCDSVLVGNKIHDYVSAHVGAIVLSEGGTLKAVNNLIWGQGYSPTTVPATKIYGIWLRSSFAEIVNNSFFINAATYIGPVVARGVYVTDGGGPITIRANIFYLFQTVNGGGDVACVEATGQSVNVSYCELSGYPVVGVGPAANCLSGDPLLVSPQLDPPDFNFQGGSPCINAGPPEAIYNDRDGSRNDMGYTGGPLYNPANYTNNNPIVFFLTGSPQTVFKGTRTNILVNAAAAAGH